MPKADRHRLQPRAVVVVLYFLPMTHITLVALFGLLLIPGLAMTLVPMLPAFWYLFGVSVVFGIIDGFMHLSASNLAMLGGLFLIAMAVDWSAGLLGAKLGGAAWKSLLLGLVGSIVGLALFPPFGIFPGLFMGVCLGELLRKRNAAEVIKAATGALFGSITGVAINVLLALIFIALFVLLAFH